MPRDGSNIYHQPHPDVVTDTTIESAVYNGFVSDLVIDLNAPRPIIAGGTAAENAEQALMNLNGEKSSQVVTNFDSHMWFPGSFRAANTASGSPASGHAFAGLVYSADPVSYPPANQNVIIHATDLDDDAVPGTLYIREKKAGVWGPWNRSTAMIEAAFDEALADLDELKVDIAGDVMTGHLTLPVNAAPVDAHAVRKDFVVAADAALKTTLEAQLDLKADEADIQYASVAEFRGNAASPKILTVATVWGASALVSVAYNATIDFSLGFDFQIPGGPIHNPLNAKQGQKGTILLQSNAYNWGTSWKFPNGVKPTWSGGNDIVSYSVLSPEYIWCVSLPNMG
jgi:hypothetical protein